MVLWIDEMRRQLWRDIIRELAIHMRQPHSSFEPEIPDSLSRWVMVGFCAGGSFSEQGEGVETEFCAEE